MWGHNKLDEIHRKLLEQNIVEIGGETDGDMALYVREAVLRLIVKDSPAITIRITSGGGSVECGLDIYDILSHYPGEKTGIVQGFAKSMAALILQACQKRQAMRHAALLIHHISMTQVSLDSLRSKTAMEKIVKNMENDQARLYKIMAERTGRSVATIRKECAKNRSMSAPEALQFGLIDEII